VRSFFLTNKERVSTQAACNSMDVQLYEDEGHQQGSYDETYEDP